MAGGGVSLMRGYDFHCSFVLVCFLWALVWYVARFCWPFWMSMCEWLSRVMWSWVNWSKANCTNVDLGWMLAGRMGCCVYWLWLGDMINIQNSVVTFMSVWSSLHIFRKLVNFHSTSFFFFFLWLGDVSIIQTDKYALGWSVGLWWVGMVTWVRVEEQMKFGAGYKPGNRSRPNWIAGPGPKLGLARKLEWRGPENRLSTWRRPNSDIYSQNYHFGLVYDMIY